jgi:hypothetical protein
VRDFAEALNASKRSGNAAAQLGLALAAIMAMSTWTFAAAQVSVAEAICRQYAAAQRSLPYAMLPYAIMYAQCMYARGYVVPGFSPSPDSPGYQGELPGPGAIGGGH